MLQNLFGGAVGARAACNRAAGCAASGKPSSIFRNRLRGMRSTVDGSAAIAVIGRVVSASSANSPSSVPLCATTAGASLAAALSCSVNEPFWITIAGVRRVADAEQHFAAVHVSRFRADRENAQRIASEHRQRRHPLQNLDVVVNRHPAVAVIRKCVHHGTSL